MPAEPDSPDNEGAQVPDVEDEAPEGFDRWRKESAIGGVGTGIARGLHAVFAPRSRKSPSWRRCRASRPMPISAFA